MTDQNWPIDGKPAKPIGTAARSPVLKPVAKPVVKPVVPTPAPKPVVQAQRPTPVAPKPASEPKIHVNPKFLAKVSRKYENRFN
jgi:hypothetical protein